MAIKDSPSPARDVIFRPNAPAVTRTAGFLVRSIPPGLWIGLYFLFSLPLLWGNWEKSATGPVPPWRWLASLAFPFMLFGLLCVLQIAGGGRRDPLILRSDGLYLPRRGLLKSFWTPVACVITPARGTPGVYVLVVLATTPLSRLTGGRVKVYSGLTDDLAHAQQFAEAFKARYGN